MELKGALVVIEPDRVRLRQPEGASGTRGDS